MLFVRALRRLMLWFHALPSCRASTSLSVEVCIHVFAPMLCIHAVAMVPCAHAFAFVLLHPCVAKWYLACIVSLNIFALTLRVHASHAFASIHACTLLASTCATHTFTEQAERGLVGRLGLPDAADSLRGVHRMLIQPSLRAMAMLRMLKHGDSKQQ